MARRALGDYLKLGYIPLENGVPDAFHQKEQVSRTLEYAYDDFVLARVAQALGHTDDADALMKARAKLSQRHRSGDEVCTWPACGRHVDYPFRSG